MRLWMLPRVCGLALAVIGAAVLDRQYGLNCGFDHVPPGYGLAIAERTAETVTDRALDWAGRRGSRSSCSSTTSIRTPITPPREPSRSRFCGDPYDGEIAYVDSQLDRLRYKPASC